MQLRLGCTENGGQFEDSFFTEWTGLVKSLLEVSDFRLTFFHEISGCFLRSVVK